MPASSSAAQMRTEKHLKWSCMNMYNWQECDMGSSRGNNVLHYPRLDTVLMVEDAIKGAKGYLTRVSLWRSLPRSVQYQTFSTILSYLEDSRKIVFSKDGKIVWVFADSAKLKKLVARSVKAHA